MSSILNAMATVTETIKLKGITCGRCVMRLRHVLADHEGLEAANANLMGDLTVTYDDELTSREALLKDVARGGFREAVT
jgi:copper chaperone CopZ